VKKSLVFLLSVYSMCLLSACGGGSTPPPPATHFSLAAPGTATAGTSFSFVVTALDASNNIATSYSGTAHFTSSDSQATLPANSTLLNGMGNLSATLKTAGNQTITATDTIMPTITGTSSPIVVSAGAATHFSVTAQATVTAGTAFSITVTALDASNNTVANYSGSVHFTSTDAQAVLPANSTLTNGVGNFSATLKTTGGQTITATDTIKASITGTSNVITVFVHCQKAGQQCPNLPGYGCCTGLTCALQGNRFYCLGPSPAAFERPSHFLAACTMGAPRESHTATLLRSGIVLITGGEDKNSSLATAELFDPDSHAFAPTGDMVDARAKHTATLLANGAVLVTGGRDLHGDAIATAELFNPANGSFAPTGSMSTARESHTATLLSNGKVLITGGVKGTLSLATTELFDPTSASFTPASSMGASRGFHAATLLKNGKVLVTGGRDADGNVLTTAELFDPANASFAPTGSMTTARESQTATLLGDGTVLITGGDDGKVSLATAELFDPASGKFTLAGTMHAAREFHTATLRNDGTVLVAGGASLTAAQGGAPTEFLMEPTVTAELFDPANHSFTITDDMANARAMHAAILLPDGKVLVTGGINDSLDSDSLESAELFQ
jgi:Galactose oxidase, central domain